MAAKQEGYISRASLRNVRVSPRRARLVVDMVRGKKVEEAIGILDFANKKTAPLLKKLLMSAVANAREQSSVDIDELMVKKRGLFISIIGLICFPILKFCQISCFTPCQDPLAS